MLVECAGDVIGAELLSPRVLRGAQSDESPCIGCMVAGEGTLKARVQTIEMEILRESLVRHHWNKSRAARELGLSRVGLRSKLERYGLERVEDQDAAAAV